jgi:hypothetical protein
MAGARLKDLRSVLAYLRRRKDLDRRIGLWGDSFAAANPEDIDFRIPRNVDGRPRGPEPLGGLLALLGGLFEDDVCAVYIRGGLSDFLSVLQEQFVYLPQDAVIPGVLRAGDLCDVAAAMAPRPLLLDSLVDGLNRPRSAKALRKLYLPALESYRLAGGGDKMILPDQEMMPTPWFLAALWGR